MNPNPTSLWPQGMVENSSDWSLLSFLLLDKETQRTLTTTADRLHKQLKHLDMDS